MRSSWLFAAGVLSLALAGGGAAHAQRPGAPSSSLAPSPSAPILFSADELQTDEDLGLIVAKGHVQISQELRTLLADTVTYNQRTDTITASGHVSLQEPTGEVLFADFMELGDHFQQGFMQDIRVLLSDRSRLAGNTARRSGQRVELRRGVYSPCDLCRDDPTRPPLWQIRAERVVHDQEAHIIEYHDATLELGGIPIFYSPYLSHPDPTVKRQSGFLAPIVGNSPSTVGFHASTPYYWAIAPDRDATFTPIFTTQEGAVFDGDYRQRFSNGEVDLNGSLNNGTSPTSNTSTLRGHIAAVGRFDLSDTWRTGFDIQRASDSTYEQVFHFGGTQNFLTSRVYAEDFGPRTLLGIDNYSFQTLRTTTNNSALPIVAPVVNYSWIGEPDSSGGRLSANANLLDLNRLRGTGSHRLSIGTAWTRPFNGLIGDLFTFTASTRADAYAATDLQVTPNQAPQNTNTGRVFPQAALQWQYPWVRRGDGYSQTLEPVVALIAGPNGGNPATIPNEDSLAFDFNDTQLFLPNRFAGLDRVDSGDRVDYGLRASLYADRGGSASMLIGQSYRFQNTGTFAPGSGLEHKKSDIVGRFVVSPSQYFDAVYRYRLSEQDFRAQRQEVTFSGGPQKLRLAVSYIRLPPDLLSNDPGNRDQISFSSTVGLSRYWTIGLATTQNLTGSLGTVSSGIVATYQDECFALITSLSQSGTRNLDVKPGASLVFTLVFKNLGEISAPAFATQGIQ